MIAPHDCSSVFNEACSCLTGMMRPSKPFRDCFLLAAAITSSLSCFRAGVWLRNEVLIFFPSFSPFPISLPTFSSPAPYRNPSLCSTVFVKHSQRINASDCYQPVQTISSPYYIGVLRFVGLPTTISRYACKYSAILLTVSSHSKALPMT